MEVKNKCLQWKRFRKINVNNYYIILVLNIYLVSLVGALIPFREANEEIQNSLRNDRPCNFLLDFNDAHLLTPAIIKKYGYPVERHWVTTEDGYILEIHRIPGKQSSTNNPNNSSYNTTGETGRSNNTTLAKTKPNPAVLLMHGVLSSSRDFVINCDRRALAFQLWQNNYDVWLGNMRGNTYCRNHTTFNPEDSKFWEFSVDEIGYYDVPAMVDHILNVTKLKEISYVGHSIGNAVVLMMLTSRPEYNEKINIWFVMSGSVSLQDTSSPLLRIFAAFPRTTEWLLTRYNHGKLFTEKFLKRLSRYAPMACRRAGRTGNHLGPCSIFYFINDGYHPGQIPPEVWTIVAGGYPTSTSVRFIVQWMQWIISGNFAKYDEGPIKNLKKYGSIAPPKYPFENLTTPTIIMYGENDWIVTRSDVLKTQRIAKNLMRTQRIDNPVELFKVASPQWNHADFIFGKDADKFVYPYILNRLESVYQHPNNEDIRNGGNRTSYETVNHLTYNDM